MANEVQEAQQSPRLLAPVMGVEERDAAVIALRAMLRRGELVDRDADLVRGAVEAMATAPTFSTAQDQDTSRLADVARNRLGKFRRGGAGTSRAAALRNYPRSGTQRMEVLMRVAREPVERGATREELSGWLGKSLNTINPRVNELMEGGWLEKQLTGDGAVATRRTVSGSTAEVLVLTWRAREELKRRGLRLVTS